MIICVKQEYVENLVLVAPIFCFKLIITKYCKVTKQSDRSSDVFTALTKCQHLFKSLFNGI